MVGISVVQIKQSIKWNFIVELPTKLTASEDLITDGRYGIGSHCTCITIVKSFIRHKMEWHRYCRKFIAQSKNHAWDNLRGDSCSQDKFFFCCCWTMNDMATINERWKVISYPLKAKCESQRNFSVRYKKFSHLLQTERKSQVQVLG